MTLTLKGVDQLLDKLAEPEILQQREKLQSKSLQELL